MHPHPNRPLRWFAALLFAAITLALAACGLPRPEQPVVSAPSDGKVRAQAIASAPPASGGRFRNVRLAFDKAGVLHLTYGVQSDKGSQLFHQQRPAEGAWSSPELLSDGVDGADLLTKPTGDVCVFWTGYVDVVNHQGNALLMRCQTGGAWSEAQPVGSFYAYEPVFAPDGTPYAPSGPNEVSLNDTLLSTSECMAGGARLAIDPTGHFHAVWGSLSNSACKTEGTEYSFSADGKTWSKPESLTERAGPVALLTDKQGRVHLLLGDGSYRQWLPGNGWGSAAKLGLPFNAVRATLDANDAIHLAAQDFLSSANNLEHYYVHQNSDGTWSAPITLAKIDDLADATIPIALDAQGQPHFAWAGKDGGLYEATVQ